jgi:hypothetical protein
MKILDSMNSFLRRALFMFMRLTGKTIFAETIMNLATVTNLPHMFPGLPFFVAPIRTDLLKVLL